MATETVSRVAEAGATELVDQLRSIVDELERRLTAAARAYLPQPLTPPAPAGPNPGGRGRYYTPSPAIREVEGVTKNSSGVWQDTYVGTLEGLVAAGIATAEMFPGQPGNGRSRTTWRVEGTRPTKGEPCSSVPGYLEIHRTVAGDFRAYLTVSREERARREQLQREERAASEDRRRQAATIVEGAQALARSLRERDELASHASLAAAATRTARPAHLRLV